MLDQRKLRHCFWVLPLGLIAISMLSQEKKNETATAPVPVDASKQFEQGKTLYESTCMACHQAHGMGQEGLAPPLVQSEWVNGPVGRLVRIVLHGMQGPVTVKNQVYEMTMPGLPMLDDPQVANVLAYVRRAWGHTNAAVSAETIKKTRAATARREEPWTADELLKIREP